MAHQRNDQKILLEAGTNEVELIEFNVGTQSFATNVAKVKKIVRWDATQVNRLDFAPNGVMGTLQFMNAPILLISLRDVLGITDAPPHLERQLVLVTEFNGLMNSFHIDGINRIHRVSWKSLQPADHIFSQNSTYTTGSVQIEDRVIMVLDLEHIIAEINPRASITKAGEKLADISEDHRRGNVRILFAEDSAMIRRLTIDQLKQAGFNNVTAVETGLKAYDWLVAEKKRAADEGRPASSVIDLILTDIEMPQMDGLTLCKNIKTTLGLGHIPVVVYSSLINEQMIKKCKAVGADAYMSKPQIDKIVEVIDSQTVTNK